MPGEENRRVRALEGSAQGRKTAALPPARRVPAGIFDLIENLFIPGSFYSIITGIQGAKNQWAASPAELREAGITEMEEANRFLEEGFIEDFNRRFMVAPLEEGEAFVPLLDVKLADILCLKHRRVVGNDNCVRYKGMSLQIPPVEDRYHFVRAKVMVHEYGDGSMAVYHGKRKVGSYDSCVRLKDKGGISRPRTQIGGHRSFTSPSSGYALGG